MKKILAISLILVLVMGSVGCQNNTPAPDSSPQDSSTEDGSTPDTDMPDNETPSDDSTLLETQTVVVEYVGQIDNNSIEVKIEDGPQALRLTGMSKEQLEELNLKEGDLIRVEVFNNDDNQQTIYSIEKAD